MSDTINRLDKARVLLNLARADAADGHWPECIHDLQQIVRDLSALHNELRDRLPAPARGLPHIEPITTQLLHMPSHQP